MITYEYEAYGSYMHDGHHQNDDYIQSYSNNFKYRGYYYDKDLELYYVNGRYYDSWSGRWINGDIYVSTGQGLTASNMFAYCGNNPVNRVDYSGEFWEEIDLDVCNTLLEGRGGGFGVGSAYHNYSVYSRTASYNAFHGNYYFSGRGTIGGYSAKFSIGGYGSVTVTDDMATDSRSTATRAPKTLSEKLALEEIKSNPQGKIISKIQLRDERWPASRGG